MHKGILRIVVVLIAALLNMVAAQASDYKGGYFGGKFGINKSSATGTINVPSASTFAYGMQGGYIQGGYNWDVSAITIGLGAYADFNSYEKHTNGVEYGSRAYGMDAKLGLPLDDWLLYGKIGYGYSSGTRDLSTIAKNSPNAALGIEYKLVSRLGAIVEYKNDVFSNKDGSIRNRTFSFGLNYYFDRPVEDRIVAAAVPELDLGPEPEADLDLASEPPPDIGSSIESSSTIPSAIPPATHSATSSDHESWKTLLENKSVIVEGINFVSGSLRLRSKAVKELDDVVGFAGKYPDAQFELFGYADSSGSAKSSQKLSLARAESVKNYLVKKDVAANRISTRGEGATDPIGDNKTKEGRTKNRRVEIRSVVKGQKNVSVAVPTPTPTPTPVPVPVPVPAPETWKILLQDKPVLINVEGTSFVSGSGTPNSKVGRELDEVVGFAGKYSEAKFELVGYADSRGSEMMNQKLSLARAASIKKYLVKKGVAANRIATKGEGSANPVGDNNTKQGRAKNRRVEIHSVINKEEKKVRVEGVVSTPTPISDPASGPGK